MTQQLDLILDDLSAGLRRRTARRRRMRALRNAMAGATAAVVLATSTAGLISQQSVTTASADTGSVLGLSGCERDAFGCLKLAKAPQD